MGQLKELGHPGQPVGSSHLKVYPTRTDTGTHTPMGDIWFLKTSTAHGMADHTVALGATPPPGASLLQEGACSGV